MLNILTIFFTGLMVGNEFAIAAFVHPAISPLPQQPQLYAAKPIAKSLGSVMPPWYALCLALLLAETWTHRSVAPGFALLLSAAILWAAVIVFTVVALVPLNNRIADVDPEAPHASWKADRQSWDSRHRARVAALAVAFAITLYALV